MKHPFRTFFCVVVLSLSLRSSSAQTKQDVTSAILARRATWNKAMVERDFDTLGGLTTPDFSTIGPAARRDGSGRYKASYVEMLKRRPALIYERTPVRVEARPGFDYAHEIGTWRERWTEPDGPTELQGDYFALWRQVGGEWKEQAEVFSPSRCLGKSFCVARPAASLAPISKELTRSYAGWYALSESMVLEIRAEGPYLVAHCPALFGDGTLVPKSDAEFHLGQLTIHFSNAGKGALAESVELIRGDKVLNRGKRLRLAP